MGDSSKKSQKKQSKAEAKPGSGFKSVKLLIGKDTHRFDVEDPKLPKWINQNALQSGGYPYGEKLKNDDYEVKLAALQMELVKLQDWLQATGNRVMSLFEGRDAAGKGGTIAAVRAFMNPRNARNVALTKPTDVEKGQWYFQRYITHFPTSGEFVTFDRSWYNRAVVERVMGFATPDQVENFLIQVPDFERLLVTEGIYFFKFWLDIGQEMQLKRFHERRHDPLKRWKFSPMDVAGMKKWDDYSDAINRMFDRTDSGNAPWTVVRSNDKRRARLAVIQRILLSIPYDGRDLAAIGSEDTLIIGRGKEFLASQPTTPIVLKQN